MHIVYVQYNQHCTTLVSRSWCSILYIQENLKLFWVFTFTENAISFQKIQNVFRIFHYIQNLTFETPKILTIFEPHWALYWVAFNRKNLLIQRPSTPS